MLISRCIVPSRWSSLLECKDMSFCVFLTALLYETKTIRSFKGTQYIPLGPLSPVGLVSSASGHQILECPYFSTITVITPINSPPIGT